MISIQENKRRMISEDSEFPSKKMKLTRDSKNTLTSAASIFKDTNIVSHVSLHHTNDKVISPFESLPTEITTDILMTYCGLHSIIDLLQLSHVSKHFHKIVSILARYITPSLQYQYHHNPLEKLHHNESDISLLVRHVEYNNKVSAGLLEIQQFFNPCADNIAFQPEKQTIHHLLQRALVLLAVRCITSLEEKKLYLVGRLAGYSYKVAKEELSFQVSEGFSYDNEYHDIYQRARLVMQIFLLKKNRLNKYSNFKKHDSKILNRIESMEDMSKVASTMCRFMDNDKFSLRSS